MPTTPTHIALFASGNGSNFEAIAQACADGRLNAQIALLVCDKPDAYVIKRAEKFNISVFAFRPKEYASKADYETEIVRLLKEKQVDLICLAGYMRLISDVLLNAFEGRIVNIHPSLLPAFKGAHAIQDAFDYGVKITGVTTHFVDKTLDGGTIIAQIPISTEGCTLEELERKIHAVEHELYIETIKQLNNI
ncbi:MAG: phosphoribosylglycinamide formyltransferase [Bacteroidales bacterium]|jgi:phosphoribosylglycinamide formyltransferase-1|nr:phosphoribosylglycinamide formyltransferase [Bacteroidales bacterium]